MANDLLLVDIIGDEELRKKLDKFPDVIVDYVSDEVAKYLIDVLKAYPPKKYVSRKDAYGVTFFTDKQRRYFFWALREGIIQVPYKRTQALRNSWEQIGKGAYSFLAANPDKAPYAYLVMGDKSQQSRHAQKIGWQSAIDIVKSKSEGIMRHADAAIKRAKRILDL